MAPLVAAGIIAAASSAASGMAQQNAQGRSSDAINNAISTLQGTEGYADQMRTQGNQVLQQMLAANQGIYGSPQDAASALAEAQDVVNSVNPYEAGVFDYDKDISDFYDKALGLRMNAANDAINQSQALGGNLFSSDTADKLISQAQVLGSEAYKDALAAYNTDKGLEQSVWQGNEAARQAAANSAVNLAQMKYGMASDTAGNIADSNNAYYTALLGLNDDYWQNKTDYISQLASLQAQDPGKRSMKDKILDPLGIFG